MRRHLLISLACLQALFVSPVIAQDCGVWLPGPKPPDFPSGFAPFQFVAHDDEIFARVRNPQSTMDLWQFDGQDWILLHWDRAAMGEPEAITFENSQLAVAARRLVPLGPGDFELKVAVHTWDGASWQEFGNLTDLYPSCTGIAARITDISFFASAWYVAGKVTGPCAPTNFVYKILPAGSISIGEVVAGLDSNLETFNNGLYLSGLFSSVYNPSANVTVNAANIAVWNGTSWQDVGGGVNGKVVNIFLWQENPSQPLSTQLVVAGKFTQAGTVAATGIAARSQAGHWVTFGSGVSWPPDFPFGGTWNGPAPMTYLVNSSTDADLIVGGMLSAGGVAIDDFARWDGSSWSTLGVGLNSAINTVVNYENEVVAGGFFSGQSFQGEPLFGVGRFDGSAWHTLSKDGTDGPVRALFRDDGVVYAGGDFTSMDGVLASHIAAHTDHGWEALSSGMNGSVLAITAFGGEIIAGGLFSEAGGIPAHNVAAWNGTSWRALGSGFDNQVNALTVWNNQLVAVGLFLGDDGQTMSLPGIAVWNGVQWSKLHPDADIAGAYAVTVHNGLLHVGGEFPGGVARWTGSQFELVGGGVSNGSVYALTSLAGSLYLGGTFLSPQSWIARFSGTQFFPLTNNGAAANFGGDVRTLVAGADELFVGGGFEVTTGKGPLTRKTARWDGVIWRALADSQIDGRVHALTLDGDRVWVGGEFVRTNNGVVSAYIAQQSESPAFVDDPVPQRVCADDGTETVEFTAAIVPESGTTFRWQRNMLDVNNNLRISGATTPTLTIFGVLPGDAGAYRLRATDECGNQTFSNNASLTFDGCCPGDMNNDDAISLLDADLFADCLAGPQIAASCPNANRAKFDADNDVDLRDAAAFQRTFAGQCP